MVVLILQTSKNFKKLEVPHLKSENHPTLEWTSIAEGGNSLMKGWWFASCVQQLPSGWGITGFNFWEPWLYIYILESTRPWILLRTRRLWILRITLTIIRDLFLFSYKPPNIPNHEIRYNPKHPKSLDKSGHTWIHQKQIILVIIGIIPTRIGADLHFCRDFFGPHKVSRSLEVCPNGSISNTWCIHQESNLHVWGVVVALTKWCYMLHQHHHLDQFNLLLVMLLQHPICWVRHRFRNLLNQQNSILSLLSHSFC